VTNFVSATIQGLFDVLRILPEAIGAIKELGIFGKIISTIIDGALILARGVVEGLVAVITAPILEVMRLAISALGVASLVLSYFSNEKLVVKPTPSNHQTFGIQPAPGNRGGFTASTASLTKDWPAALVDCAKVSGTKIPELIKAGDKATWKLVSGAELITLDALEGAVGSDKTAKIDFTTGTEDAETAKGDERTNSSRVAVSVPRKEVSDFLDLAAREIENVKADILSKIPGPLQGAANLVFANTIDPLVKSIRSSIEGAVGGILTLKGEGSVFVTYHSPKEPTPTPTPTEPEEAEGNFCAEFKVQADLAAIDLATSTNPFGWGGSLAERLKSIQASPPAELAADFAMTIAFYEIVGTSSIGDTQRMADFIAANDIDPARKRLWNACGAAYPEL
jgi:hypothetical protein